jgi:hypothetical protein
VAGFSEISLSLLSITLPVQYTAKARFLAGESLGFCNEARPLRRIYSLGEGDAGTLEFTPLGPGEALIELVRHSFLMDIEEPDMLARHFDRLARLVNRTCFYRLDYPRRYEALAQVRQAIIEHDAEESEVP